MRFNVAKLQRRDRNAAAAGNRARDLTTDWRAERRRFVPLRLARQAQK